MKSICVSAWWMYIFFLNGQLIIHTILPFVYKVIRCFLNSSCSFLLCNTHLYRSLWMRYLWVLVKWVVKHGSGREFRNWKPVFFITSKYIFILIEIRTHDSACIYVYSLIISSRNIVYIRKLNRSLFSLLVKWVESPVLTFLCFKAVLQL